MSEPFKAIKKPIEIDAWEITYHHEKNLLPEWARILTEWRTSENEPPVLHCYCDTGLQTAKLGDFLVRGPMNDIYPIPRAIFLNTYNRA